MKKLFINILLSTIATVAQQRRFQFADY